ncbi:MAG: hypothetical protein ICV64_10350 [Thermoleophilia bacterium]|nr:hypothetical protein [Thermoleophilia bacterium]
MELTTVFAALSALGLVLAAAALVLAVTARAGRRLLRAAALLLAGLATGAWVAFALEPSAEVALSAGGLTATVLAALASLPVRAAIERARRIGEELARAEQRLHDVVEREAEERAAELERLLARARADSLSRLAAEERRVAEERRAAFAEREREAGAELAQAVASVQARVERRIADWADDLERTEQRLEVQLQRLRERQAELIAEAEARIAVDVERLQSETEQQRGALMRLREELGRAAEQVVAQSTAELEEHAAERRRALHELSDRLRRRERELFERIEREETEARQRVAAGFSDLERRVLEQLQRSTELAVTRHSEAAAHEFVAAIKTAREDAARRLARELDRAVENFTREASTVLAARLAEVGDTGVRRVENRIGAAAAGTERRQDELLRDLEQRLTGLEQDFRRRVATIAADADAERGVLDARLRDLARRLDETAEQARERLGVRE